MTKTKTMSGEMFGDWGDIPKLLSDADIDRARSVLRQSESELTGEYNRLLRDQADPGFPPSDRTQIELDRIGRARENIRQDIVKLDGLKSRRLDEDTERALDILRQRAADLDDRVGIYAAQGGPSGVRKFILAQQALDGIRRQIADLESRRLAEADQYEAMVRDKSDPAFGYTSLGMFESEEAARIAAESAIASNDLDSSVIKIERRTPAAPAQQPPEVTNLDLARNPDMTVWEAAGWVGARRTQIGIYKTKADAESAARQWEQFMGPTAQTEIVWQPGRKEIDAAMTSTNQPLRGPKPLNLEEVDAVIAYGRGEATGVQSGLVRYRIDAGIPYVELQLMADARVGSTRGPYSNYPTMPDPTAGDWRSAIEREVDRIALADKPKSSVFSGDDPDQLDRMVSNELFSLTSRPSPPGGIQEMMPDRFLDPGRTVWGIVVIDLSGRRTRAGVFDSRDSARVMAEEIAQTRTGARVMFGPFVPSEDGTLNRRGMFDTPPVSFPEIAKGLGQMTRAGRKMIDPNNFGQIDIASAGIEPPMSRPYPTMRTEQRRRDPYANPFDRPRAEMPVDIQGWLVLADDDGPRRVPIPWAEDYPRTKGIIVCQNEDRMVQFMTDLAEVDPVNGPSYASKRAKRIEGDPGLLVDLAESWACGLYLNPMLTRAATGRSWRFLAVGMDSPYPDDPGATRAGNGAASPPKKTPGIPAGPGKRRLR